MKGGRAVAYCRLPEKEMTENDYYGKLRAASEAEKDQILTGEYYLIDDGSFGYVVGEGDIAKIIAMFPATFTCTSIYDKKFHEVATTIGNFLDRADADFREKIIEDLVKYQTGNEEDIPDVPVVSAEVLHGLTDENGGMY